MHGVRLPWEKVPGHVHRWVDDVLGSPVVKAVSQPGGFSPGTADRVVTADGVRAFVKAVSPAQNPDTPDLHRREISVLRTLTYVSEVPRLIDARDDGEWVTLVIEDVDGRHPRLPWTDDELAAALHTLTRLAEHDVPPSWPALEDELAGMMTAWSRLPERPPAQLEPWAADDIDVLDELSRATLPRLAGTSVVHLDARADNLLVQPDGAVRVVDWPWASRGAAWFDAVALLINVRWSGDLDVRPYLPRIRELGATEEDVLGLLAGLGGFFLEAAAQPPAPGLPTLREFQAAQGRACLRLLQELSA